MITKQCVCGNEFSVLPYRDNTAKYCSKRCTSIYAPRTPLSTKTKEKISIAVKSNPKMVGLGKLNYKYLQEYYKVNGYNERKKYPIGKDNPKWTGGKCIEKQCLQCTNLFNVHPYRKDTSNYCSRKCLNKSRVGISAWNKGKINVFSQETLNRMKEKALNRVVKKFDYTSIENMIYGELLKRNLAGFFDRAKPMFNHFRADLVSEKFKMIIECDGDYWHANPQFMKDKPLNLIQHKKIIKDKEVRILADKNNYLLLRFWETDIKKDISGIGDFIQNCCNRGLAIVV